MGAAADHRASSLVPSDRFMAAVLVGWAIWVAFVTIWSDRSVLEGLAYAKVPVVLVLGMVFGRLSGRPGGPVLLVAVASALALVLLVVDPFYTNAQAAAGVQLVALAGLVLQTSWQRAPGLRAVTAAQTVFTGAAGVLGVLLAASAQAASVLVVLVVVAVASASAPRLVLPRTVIISIGLAAVGAVMSVVLVLGRMPRWPAVLSGNESLSWARHDLWRDALELLQLHPVTGGGPGSFFEHSGTARSAPHLYAAHSSILQVAAELGIVGVLLFVAVLVAGALVASQGDRARGLIGVTAWCALAVHSMIDHLYECPLVVLLAGVVIGWAGSRVRDGGPPLISALPPAIDPPPAAAPPP
ncbi:MAG: O-antigen ligase family protein [Brachybacterium sp.]|uniref:O-antigen ligase family protein n=1 Tax=Brachybacterium sp. TaxID=1891286 RepID=UPI002649755D|nr:O-antigen ligase family protein [Brachybacterium sp.]MDN5686073.1 O-antigen ligase family protein [Brachybacterium sp.]